MATRDVPWTYETVCRMISEMKSLETIHLVMKRPILAEFGRLSTVRRLLLNLFAAPSFTVGWTQRLIANVPKLSSLSLSFSEPINVEDLFAARSPDEPLHLEYLAFTLHPSSIVGANIIPHIRSLTTLRMIRGAFNSTAQWSSFASRWFRLLLAEHIPIVQLQLASRYLDEETITQLGSISTMRKLTVVVDHHTSYLPITPNGEEPEVVKNVVQQFYTMLSERHTLTLQHLAVDCHFKGSWCFNDHHLEALVHCRALRTLEVVVSSAERVFIVSELMLYLTNSRGRSHSFTL